jgi:hypothetical protein
MELQNKTMKRTFKIIWMGSDTYAGCHLSKGDLFEETSSKKAALAIIRKALLDQKDNAEFLAFIIQETYI